MFPQITCLIRCIITLVAFVWLFSTVCYQMPRQMACLRICIITLVAFVQLFSTVGPVTHSDKTLCIVMQLEEAHTTHYFFTFSPMFSFKWLPFFQGQICCANILAELVELVFESSLNCLLNAALQSWLSGRWLVQILSLTSLFCTWLKI